MLQKLLEFFHLDGNCVYKDACPYYNHEHAICYKYAGGPYCGKWRRFNGESDLQVIKSIVANKREVTDRK